MCLVALTSVHRSHPSEFWLSISIGWSLDAELEPRGRIQKEKHGVWDPMPELTITSPYINSRVDSNTFTMGNPMPESTLTRLCPPVRDFGFGLWAVATLLGYIGLSRNTAIYLIHESAISHPHTWVYLIHTCGGPYRAWIAIMSSSVRSRSRRYPS
jgi:hypothetical protein